MCVSGMAGSSSESESNQDRSNKNGQEKSGKRLEDKNTDDVKSTLDMLLEKFNKVEERMNRIEKKTCANENSSEESSSEGDADDSSNENAFKAAASENARTHGKTAHTKQTTARGDSGKNSHAKSSGIGKHAVKRKRKESLARGDDDDEDDFSDRGRNMVDFARGETVDALSVSDFQIELETKGAEALDDLENDLEIKVEDGDRVHDKLANVLFNRFTAKMPKEKLEGKMKGHKVPENCGAMKAPRLDDTLVDKGLVDRNTRKDDGRLSDIQKMIATATAALAHLTNEINEEVAKSKDQKGLVDMANKVIKVNGDVFAILGMAQQDLSQRRRFEIGRALPKDVASIATANIRTGSEMLFGDEVERLMRNARDTHRATANRGGRGYHPHKRGQGQRYHPYSASQRDRFQGQQKPSFLGRGQPYSQKGGGNNRGTSFPRRGNYKK